MAFNKFGIKEVADVKFYDVDKVSVDAQGKVTATGSAVLELDTLKVSTIEFTAEQSEARGGKGNPPLIIWDYGREINVTLEDALLSAKTMNLMFGESGTDNVIEINANKFPGTYAVVGKTFARGYEDGKDRVFTFYIPKAKIQSENTLTMEAEGDPTVFNMSLRVMRGEGGKMMELILDTSATVDTIPESHWSSASATAKYSVTFMAPGFSQSQEVVYNAATPAAPTVDGISTWKTADGIAHATSTKVTKNTTYYGS